MTKTSRPKSAIKTYVATYAEDVCRYGSLDIEAASDAEAIEKAKAQNLDEVYFDAGDSEPFRRELLRIEDEDGKIIAEEIPLDEFFTGYGAEDRRLFELAWEMLEALRWQEMAEADPAAGRRKGYIDRAREARRAVLAKAQGEA